MRTPLAALCASLVLGATPALADGQLVGKLTAPTVDHHTWYVTIGGGVDVVNLQDWDILWNDTTDMGNPVRYEDSIVGGGYQITLGHVFGKQLDPQIWGGRLHVSASGYYFHGDSSDTVRSPDGVDVDMISVTAGFPFTLLDPQDVSFASQVRSFGVELRAGVDYPVAEGLWVTPSLAFFGGSSDTEQRALIKELPDAGPPNFYDRLFQDMNTDRIGAAAGLGASYHLGGGFYVKGGAQVGVVYASTNGDLYQCAGGLAVESICDGLFIDESLSAQEDSVALVAGGGLGFEYDLGFAIVGLSGQVSYDGATPSFDYPDFPGDSAVLEHVGSWSYGGGLTLTVPIN